MSQGLTFSGGVNGQAAGGTQETLTVGGNWSPGDTWSITLTDTSGSITIGVGTIFGQVPVAALTLANRVYFVAGSNLYLSSIGDPSAWDPQDVGSGYIPILNRSASSEALTGLASYQGRLAVFSPRTIQIWTIDADPSKFALNQVLQNIGAKNSLSIQSFGDMDVFFVSNTGVRSLRVRDSSLNAFVSDIGSPIDMLVASSLQKQAASGVPICGSIEPDDNRYWVFINDVIYVLSYFPASKVAAWSTYEPSYKNINGVQTLFTPVLFAVSENKVWARDVNGSVYVFSGLGVAPTFDNSITSVETPWMDVKKPATWKTSRGVDMSATGVWTLFGTMDYLNRDAPKFKQIVKMTKPTFDYQPFSWSDRGTHFKLRAINVDEADGILSMLIWHFKEENEK